MGATTTYGLPYPEPSDPPDGPSQIQALAEAVEAALARPKIASGSVTTSLTGEDFQRSDVNVLFPSGLFTQAPAVALSFDLSGAVTTGMNHKVVTNAVTSTGFTIRVERNTNTADETQYQVDWIAVEGSDSA